jgi:phospho-N-acetylmuramoyl-pentapeptide-transferase
MFLKFLYPLVKFFTPLNIFSYITFRGSYAALTTLLICFIFGNRIIAALKNLKVGQVIREDGPQSHLVKSGTPTMGGIFVIATVLFAMLLWGDLSNKMVWLTMGTLLSFGGIGFLDDYLKVTRKNPAGLPAWAKLILQFAAATAAVLIIYFTKGEDSTVLYIPFFKNPVFDMGPLWIPFGILLIVGESNAVNISDGLDGLLAGLLLLVFIALAILTYISGRVDYAEYLGIPYIPGAGELTVFCLAAAGAVVAFLWFNSHPAEIFMGDTGSLSLGGVIAVISLLLKKEILVLIIGGVFVIEIASVIIQVASYKIRKKRVYLCAPLHHHLELSGWPEVKVVVRLWILGGFFAIIALSTLKLQ